MTDDLETRLREDRAVRNAAFALIQADIAQSKGNFAAKSLGRRFAERMTEGTADVYDEAVEVAGDNKGVLITLIAAIIMWFARNPVLSLFSDDDEEGQIDEDQEH